MSKLKLSFAAIMMLLLVGMFSNAAFANGSLDPENQTDYSNLEMESLIPEADNGIVNANKSGTVTNVNDGSLVNDVIKSDGMVKNNGTTGTHKTHGEYQNNTNSCASCHQTHTAESKNLLFKNGVYNTCTACHDGTLGFYNVFEGSNAGTFGGTHDGNMSVHLATGAVKIAAAPGGNAAGAGSWTGEFNCASCHAPHGSYSERLLHYNPNKMGIAAKTEGGIGYKNAPVVAGVPASPVDTDPAYILVRQTARQLGLTIADIKATDDAALDTTTVISGYKLKKATTSPVAPAVYQKDSTPWLYGYEFQQIGAARVKVYFTGFSETTMEDANLAKVWNYDDKTVTFNFAKGFAYTSGAELNNVILGNVARAYVVDLDLVKDVATSTGYGVDIFTSQIAGMTSGGKGVAMSAYCASCHTDYLAASGSGSGTFSTAYRHTTTSDSYTCVRCHFAHGTDVTVMKDAEAHTVAEIVANTTEYFTTVTDATERQTLATNYMLDKNPSSALKRFTNMSVCWSCHTSSKAEQLKNNAQYGNNDGQEDPHGLPTGN